jgi:predicted dehydrogenase/protein-L-isoaspartate O-methyltransferase
VSFEHGAFATVGAIAMHGVRQAEVSLGERVAVIGLGLVGQLAGMLLRAAGCTVVGIDLDGALLDRARANSALDLAAERTTLDPGNLPAGFAGCDAVVITAATSSDDPIRLAAALCRDRGRVVIVGDVGLDVPRAPYYDKEIDIRLSRSYGPGRYDRSYEERGLDYPLGYVRWTERRNMEAFVELLAARRFDLEGLVTERVPVEDAPAAYDRLVSGDSSPLGIVLQYEETTLEAARTVQLAEPPALGAAPSVGQIGTGSFAQRILLPGLRDAGFTFASVASASGLTARSAAERFPFARVTDPHAVISDADVDIVAIATRHATHADLGVRALRAGKAVYVEKPPCLTWDELEALELARRESGRLLFVGFNRRHAPLTAELTGHVSGRGFPLQVLIRVNAGALPADHWLNDPVDGGGRLLGEGCHFIDLASWIVGAPAEQVSCTVRPLAGETVQTAQRFTVTLGYADGSVATILYADGGAADVAKEHIEAHAGGRSAVLHDFRSLELRDGSKRRTVRQRGQDKGHRRQLEHLREVLERGGRDPGLDPLSSMAATLAALDAASDGRTLRCGGLFHGHSSLVYNEPRGASNRAVGDES